MFFHGIQDDLFVSYETRVYKKREAEDVIALSWFIAVDMSSFESWISCCRCIISTLTVEVLSSVIKLCWKRADVLGSIYMLNHFYPVMIGLIICLDIYVLKRKKNKLYYQMKENAQFRTKKTTISKNKTTFH